VFVKERFVSNPDSVEINIDVAESFSTDQFAHTIRARRLGPANQAATAL
jgi:hypothetical protein